MKLPTIHLKTTVFLLIIGILLVVLIMTLQNSRKLERTAVTFAQVVRIESALSTFMAQRGVYPEGLNLILGGSDAGVLCLGKALDSREGFLPQGACDGNVILDMGTLGPLASLSYSSTEGSYGVSFIMEHSFGAFTKGGWYCATEQGILKGRCGEDQASAEEGETPVPLAPEESTSSAPVDEVPAESVEEGTPD